LSLRAENPDSIIEHELRKQDLYDNKRRLGNPIDIGKENDKGNGNGNGYTSFFDEDEISKR
jgi:hypothetical protein|tara:strand:- start:74 stop:256 length:183 start_codon:yes stop_codon:yes gene_type:complete